MIKDPLVKYQYYKQSKKMPELPVAIQDLLLNRENLASRDKIEAYLSYMEDLRQMIDDNHNLMTIAKFDMEPITITS